MARDAYPFLIPLLVLAGGSFYLRWNAGAAVLFLLAVFVAFFFRDPERNIPNDADAIVSPADGKVIEIQTVQRNGQLQTKVGIFLSVFNVHVNRSPVAGRITHLEYKKGKFKLAYDPAASAENEQNRLVIESASATLEVVQIAGLIARRIVCYKKVGDALARGERIGLIKFGSKVDCYLPTSARVMVNVGDWIHGGSTLLARLQKE